MYLLALICPPLAVLLSGRLFGAMLAVPLTLMAWFPGALYAILVVADRKAKKRFEELARSIGVSMAGAVSAGQVAQAKAMAAARGESTTLVDEMLAEHRIETERKARRLSTQAARDSAERRAAFLAAIRSLPIRFVWLVDDIRVASVRAYLVLPEWAQPVSWGLAIGTPFAIIATVLFLRR